MKATTEDPPSYTQAQALGLRRGELVRVRSAIEIASTLNDQGSLEGMPFMPEMLQYCGGTFRVSRRADKTCAGDGAVRRLNNSVHLADLRCDGASHGGCQAACLLFWKEAWLERVESEATPAPNPPSGDESQLTETLFEATRADASSTAPGYRCQATEIPNASTPLRYRELDQYVKDVRNWGLAKILRGLLVEGFNLWQRFASRHLPHGLLINGGRTYPFLSGALPEKKGATPSATLDLRPGDLVRIKSKEEIESTLDRSLHNRGLGFDPEMTRYCGQTARVRARVNRLVDERSGEMIEITSDCIMLEGIVCSADYHRFCARAIYSYWREIWLERIDEPTGNGTRPSSVGVTSVREHDRPPCARSALH